MSPLYLDRVCYQYGAVPTTKNRHAVVHIDMSRNNWKIHTFKMWASLIGNTSFYTVVYRFFIYWMFFYNIARRVNKISGMHGRTVRTTCHSNPTH